MKRIWLGVCAVGMLMGAALTSAEEVFLYPEEERMQYAFLQEGLYFPMMHSYGGALPAEEASTMIHYFSGTCTGSLPCTAPLLFAKEQRTQGTFLQVLYEEALPERAAAMAKRFPALKDSPYLYLRDAWQLGLITTYDSEVRLSAEEQVAILYRYLVYLQNKKLHQHQYQLGLVYDEGAINAHYFQDQEELLEIIEQYQQWIQDEQDPTIQLALGARKDAFEAVYYQLVQDDRTYQQRPFGNPVGVGLGEDVVVTYGFKDPRYRSHTGVDIAPYYAKKAELGAIPILARQSGIAIFVKWDVPGTGKQWNYTHRLNGYGNHVIVISEEFFRRVQGDKSLSKNKQVYATLYGHLAAFSSFEPVDNPIVYKGLIDKFYFGERKANPASYANLKIVGVKTVTAGDTLGLMGNTGRSTSDHLHYEVRAIGADLDKVTIINPERFHIEVPHYDLAHEAPSLSIGGGGEDANKK